MKKILKKNQVIITSLAVLIAVAGYLNFADVDLGLKNKEASADSSSILEDVDYDLTDETAFWMRTGRIAALRMCRIRPPARRGKLYLLRLLILRPRPNFQRTDPFPE